MDAMGTEHQSCATQWKGVLVKHKKSLFDVFVKEYAALESALECELGSGTRMSTA